MKNTTDVGLLILRVGVSLYMIAGHGWGKMMNLLSGDLKFASVLGMPESVSLILAVFGEVVCPALIIIGFKTRLAAIPAAFTMFTAGIIIHANDPWLMANAVEGGGSKEMALLFMIPFLALALTGGGKYSLDKGK